MRLMALDVSSSSTGWFVSKTKFGLITPDDKLSAAQKLSYFRDEVEKLLEKYKPTEVVIEDNYFLKNIGTLKVLARFQGVAIEICNRRGAKVSIITATEARKYCCGKQEGKFKKPEVFKFFVGKYGFDDWKFEEKNDITDAMALYYGFIAREKKLAKNSN